jgi:hypothetical protein
MDAASYCFVWGPIRPMFLQLNRQPELAAVAWRANELPPNAGALIDKVRGAEA